MSLCCVAAACIGAETLGVRLVAQGNDDDALFSLAVLAPPVAEQSTCLVARAVMEPPVAAAWRLGVLRFGKQRPAPRLLCSGWDLFADAPGPAALLVIPPNPGRIGWSFAAVPLTDAFSAEATQLGDAADSPASLMAHYAALGAHVLPHELAETTPTRDSLRAWLLRAAAPPRAWCWLASASSQAIRLGHSRRVMPPTAVLLSTACLALLWSSSQCSPPGRAMTRTR